MKKTFGKISKIVQVPSPTEDLIVDSTPLEGPKDSDALHRKPETKTEYDRMKEKMI